MRLVILLTPVAVLLGLPTPAQASSTLFSIAPDLSATQTSDCVYNTVCGPLHTGDTYAAQLFTLSSDAIITGFGFNSYVPVGDYGTAANYYVLSANGSNAPGSVLASGSALLSHSIGPFGTNQFVTTDYSFDVSPLQLSAGNYFLAFQDVTTNFEDYLSKGSGSSGAFESDNGGVTYSAGYGAVNRELSNVSITVFGDAVNSAVPEPRTWAMMLLGFAAIGFAMRRRWRPILAQLP